MRPHLLEHLLLSATGVALAFALSDNPYALIADAGSTGTRVYLFQLVEPGHTILHEGVCEYIVERLDDCSRAAYVLKLVPEATAAKSQPEAMPHLPRGCYVDTRGVLMWNNGSNGGSCSAGTACICKDGSSAARVDVTDLGKGPALSSFQDTPTEAAATVRKQIDKAKLYIPEKHHSSVPVSVLATAGMRLVDPAKAEAVYAGLQNGLLDSSYPFRRDSFQARTISGRDEAIFAFIAANYLAERISTDLQVLNSDLMGVMDLGGSSTQIAVPPKIDAGASLAGVFDHRYLRVHEGMYVQSFLSFGMERMRNLTYRHIVEEAHWLQRLKSQVPNPCAFLGDAEDIWRGTGDSSGCQEMIATVLGRERHHCEKMGAHSSEAHQCPTMKMVGVAESFARPAAPRFFLISGYIFVTDFARWWIEHPGVMPQFNASGGPELPALLKLGTDFFGRGSTELSAQLRAIHDNGLRTATIAELRIAAAFLCSEPWRSINASAQEKSRHRMTPSHKMPHRCFEMNYIITLLSRGYGFRENARPFQFVEQLGGRDVEWTLGAFLLSHTEQTSYNGSQENTLGTSKETFLVTCVAMTLAVSILCLLRRRWRNSDCGDCLPGQQVSKVA